MSHGPSWGVSKSKEETMIDNVLSRRAILALAGVACVGWVGSATAATVSFKVPLSGAEQVPPVTTAGKGSAELTWDPSTRVVTWNITDSGLTGPVTMAHFHDGAEGKNGPVAIWLTKKDTEATGAIKGEATLTPQQAQQFEAGDWYINLHTKDHPAGEIRGQVKPPKG
jgi:CHRD domain